ncbi:MAG: hypothetical protein WCC37_25640 [Candidatus Sulfotelmatobacter sp.]
MLRITRRLSLLAAVASLMVVFPGFLAVAAAPVDPKTVAVVDAGLGPCAADFTITDAANQPVYGANIRVRITYGFLNLHKLDLQVGTNAEGKARFVGLPGSRKQGLFFLASEGDREGSSFDDPGKTCKTQFTIVLRKKSLQP